MEGGLPRGGGGLPWDGGGLPRGGLPSVAVAAADGAAS